MKQFKGRVVTPGTCTAEAVVTTQGFNTLASLQMALQFGDKKVKCGDQNNAELNGKPLINKALCLVERVTKCNVCEVEVCFSGYACLVYLNEREVLYKRTIHMFMKSFTQSIF